MSSALEQRVHALVNRFNVIERSLGELQLKMVATNAAPPVAAASPPPSAVMNVANYPNLQPCAQDTEAVARLRQWCLEHGLLSAAFQWVPSEYYSHSLQWRRDVLQAASVQHLCKTIVLENTHCVHTDCAVKENSRYYMIVYQYVEKFDADQVMRIIRELNAGLGKKKFNFRLADPSKSHELTGFEHGAVVPFGTKQPIPVILSASLKQLSPSYFWVGGGHVDCKCRVDLDEFTRVMQPIIAPITVPLTAEELEQIVD